MVKSKHNKSIKYFAVVFAVALMFCLTAPCFASSDSSTPRSDFLLLNYKEDVQLNNNNNTLYGTVVGTTPSGVVKALSNKANTYCFAVGIIIYAINTVDFNCSCQTSYNSGNAGLITGYNNDEGLFIKCNQQIFMAQHNITFDSAVPVFESVEDAIDAFINGTGSGATSSFPLSYDLPAGNVAFIELNSESASGLSKLYTTMPEGSGLFASGSGSSGSDIWRGNTQMYCYTNSIPAGSVSFPMSGMSLIPWSKYGQQNLFGVTKSAGWTISNINTSGYLVIYNPLAYVAVEGGNGAETEFPTNGSIHINIPAVSSIKVFQLNASATISPGVAPSNWQTSTDTGNTWDASFDPDTGAITWTDQNGNTGTSPTVGGSNIVSGTQSIMELLSSFFSRLSEFFTLGYNAISTLVGSASEFVSHFMALYSWLPPGVLSVLTSALVLALTIGVIKIFI